MCAEINKHDRREMSFARFLDHVQKGYEAGLRYCFVLGAGASKKSGIDTGIDLIKKWRGELLPKGRAMLLEIMESVGIDSTQYDYFFGGNYKVKSSDYSSFFDMRFEGVPAAAYKALQDLMMNAKASFGYYALAVLLCETQNKIVITTNFDTLTEDTLFLYCSEHPLVVGHESLAPYMEATENQARPIVAKVHRDLMLEPLNREEELKKLEDSWKKPLISVLSRYIPIVIGYAGGDQTLMGLLSEIDLKGIYWCNYEGEPDASVQELLTKPGTSSRYLVNLEETGFDKVMYKLVKVIQPDFNFDTIKDGIVGTTQERADIFYKQYSEFAEEDSSKKGAANPEKEAGGTKAGMSEPAQPAEHHPNTDDDVAQSLKDLSEASLVLMDTDAFNAGKYEKSLEICNELLSRQPEEAKYWNSRSTTYHEMGRYEEALADATKAVELAPEEAKYWNSRSTNYHEMGRYEEALADATKAVELAPEDAFYRRERGVTLRAMGRYEEALADKTKAVELEPKNADYWDSRSETYYAMRRYQEALEDINEAIALDSGNKNYQKHRAYILKAMGK